MPPVAFPPTRAATPSRYCAAALVSRGWSSEAAAWVGAASIMAPRPLHLPPLPPSARALILPGLLPPCSAPHWAPYEETGNVDGAAGAADDVAVAGADVAVTEVMN